MPSTDDQEPTQETQPRYEYEATGPPMEIPVPTREAVLRDLAKVAKRRKDSLGERSPEE